MSAESVSCIMCETSGQLKLYLLSEHGLVSSTPLRTRGVDTPPPFLDLWAQEVGRGEGGDTKA